MSRLVVDYRQFEVNSYDHFLFGLASFSITAVLNEPMSNQIILKFKSL